MKCLRCETDNDIENKESFTYIKCYWKNYVNTTLTMPYVSINLNREVIPKSI